mmetsp:Transcript_29301/g.40639  ORF Transcript_29301/g.40639 Transcript_29301/m.40639 type:complete len:507 (-) Transcript_29301:123-1643(-)
MQDAAKSDKTVWNLQVAEGARRPLQAVSLYTNGKQEDRYDGGLSDARAGHLRVPRAREKPSGAEGQWEQQLQQQQPCGCCLGRHTRTVTNLSFSMDGKLLVSMSINYIIKIWDIMERSLLKTFTRDGVDRVFFTTDTTIAMKGVYQGGGNFKYWIEFKDAFKKDSKRKVIDLGGGRSFSGEQQQQCCRLSSDGSKFAHWYRKELQIRGTEELRIVHKIKIIDRNMCFEGPVVFSKDCSSIAAVVVEDAEARRSHHQMGLTQRIAYIKVWNLKTAPVNAPASCIFSVKTVTPWIIKFCPMDSRVLASASFSDRKVKIWNITSSKLLQVVDDNPHDVNPRNHRAANMGGRDVRSMNFLFSKDGGTFVLSKTREDFIYDMTMDEDRPMDRITRFTIWKVGDDRRVMSALARDLLQVEMLHKSIVSATCRRTIHHTDYFGKTTTLDCCNTDSSSSSSSPDDCSSEKKHKSVEVSRLRGTNPFPQSNNIRRLDKEKHDNSLQPSKRRCHIA